MNQSQLDLCLYKNNNLKIDRRMIVGEM